MYAHMKVCMGNEGEILKTTQKQPWRKLGQNFSQASYLEMKTEQISRTKLHLRYVWLITLLIGCLDVSLTSSSDMKDVLFACL